MRQGRGFARRASPEDELQVVIDALGDGIVTVDTTGRVSQLSPGAARLLGWSADALVGQDLASATEMQRRDGERSTALTSAAVLELTKAVPPRPQAVSLTGADHVERHLSLTPVVATRTRRRESVQLVVKDRGGDVALERELAQVTDSLEQFLDTVPEGVAAVVDGRIVRANPKLCSLLGLDDPSAGPALTDVVHPDDLMTFAGLLRGRYEVTTLRLVAKGDRVPVVEARLATMTLLGQPTELLFLHDITRQRELEVSLAAADRLSTLGALATGLAHDLRNSLGALQGLTDYMSECVRDDVELDREELLSVLEDELLAIRGMSALVKSLHELGTARHQNKVSDLSAATETVRRLTSHAMRGIGELKIAIDPALPSVPMRHAALVQVLMNLVINAAQAMASGKRRGDVEVRGRVDDGHLLIEVQDQGPGFSAGVTQNIFRTAVTTREAEGGTGLGLAIVRRLVEDAGGRVRADAPTEGGALFVIRVPLSPAGERAAPPES